MHHRDDVPGAIADVVAPALDLQPGQSMPLAQRRQPVRQLDLAALPRLGVTGVSSVRIGKRIELEFDGELDLEQAREIADKLLANPVIEDFTVHPPAAGAEVEK